MLKVKSHQFLNYQEVHNLLVNNKNVKNVFQYYSVSKLEVVSLVLKLVIYVEIIIKTNFLFSAAMTKKLIIRGNLVHCRLE